MRKVDGLYSFRLFRELDKINGQYHLGWEINDLDSLVILSKILSVEVLQHKSSIVNGCGSTNLVKG
jgi:hypothetical protein